MRKPKDRPLKPRHSADPTTWPELVRDAWALRQELSRRLLLLDVERAQLERTAATLDATFVGAALPPEDKP